MKIRQRSLVKIALQEKQQLLLGHFKVAGKLIGLYHQRMN
jgi:hypothetical protein